LDGLVLGGVGAFVFVLSNLSDLRRDAVPFEYVHVPRSPEPTAGPELQESLRNVFKVRQMGTENLRMSG
jgi:hypothetical protein